MGASPQRGEWPVGLPPPPHTPAGSPWCRVGGRDGRVGVARVCGACCVRQRAFFLRSPGRSGAGAASRAASTADARSPPASGAGALNLGASMGEGGERGGEGARP